MDVLKENDGQENVRGTNMGLDNISRGLEIGAERMKIVREMAALLTFADTEEDLLQPNANDCKDFLMDGQQKELTQMVMW